MLHAESGITVVNLEMLSPRCIDDATRPPGRIQGLTLKSLCWKVVRCSMTCYCETVSTISEAKRRLIVGIVWYREVDT
jgi:hypothetical protein